MTVISTQTMAVMISAKLSHAAMGYSKSGSSVTMGIPMRTMGVNVASSLGVVTEFIDSTSAKVKRAMKPVMMATHQIV